MQLTLLYFNPAWPYIILYAVDYDIIISWLIHLTDSEWFSFLCLLGCLVVFLRGLLLVHCYSRFTFMPVYWKFEKKKKLNWTTVKKFITFSSFHPQRKIFCSLNVRCRCESKMCWEGSPAWALFWIQYRGDQHSTVLIFSAEVITQIIAKSLIIRIVVHMPHLQ